MSSEIRSEGRAQSPLRSVADRVHRVHQLRQSGIKVIEFEEIQRYREYEIAPTSTAWYKGYRLMESEYPRDPMGRLDWGGAA